MANLAGFDQEVNVSLESKFFPKIEENENYLLVELLVLSHGIKIVKHQNVCPDVYVS